MEHSLHSNGSISKGQLPSSSVRHIASNARDHQYAWGTLHHRCVGEIFYADAERILIAVAVGSIRETVVCEHLVKTKNSFQAHSHKVILLLFPGRLLHRPRVQRGSVLAELENRNIHRGWTSECSQYAFHNRLWCGVVKCTHLRIFVKFL